MVRQRRPVQPTSLQEAVQVQPVASPAGGPATTAAPVNLPIFDYAAISGTLRTYLERQQQEQKDREIQAGEKYAADNSAVVADIEDDAAKIKDPKAQRKFVEDTFRGLIDSGVVPPSASPLWQVGYNRYAGREAGQRYRARLRARLNDLSAARDADGNLATAPDVEGAIADEWEKTANAPSVRNFYGGEEALREKAQADEEFRTAVFSRRSSAQQKEYEDGLQREVGSQFEYIVQSNPVVTSETLEGVTAYVTQEMYRHNVPNPRELVVSALETSIQKLVQTDPETAVRAAHAAQELKIGDVKLGDDRGPIGTRVQQMVDEVNQRANEATYRELQREESQRRLAIQRAEKDYLPLLVQAKDQGRSVRAAADELKKRILFEDAASGAYGGRGVFVVQALDEAATALDSTRQSDRLVLDQFQRLLATGKLEDARLLLESGLSQGSLTGGDYLTATTALGERQSASHLMEDNTLYRGYFSRYDELKPKGFTPDVQQKVNERVLELQERMERDYLAVVQKGGKEDRAWLGERWAADQQAIKAMEQEFRGGRDQTEVALRQKLTRYQDASTDIEQAERNGTLTVPEAQEWRERNLQAAQGRESLLNSRAAGEAEQDLEAQFKAAGDLEDAEGFGRFSAARQELRDRYAAAVDGILADPKVDPRSFQQRTDAEIRRISRELRDQLYPSSEAGAQRAIQGGASVKELQAKENALDADTKLQASLRDSITDPRSREQLSVKHPFFTAVAVPEVPQEFYRYSAGWMSQVDPVFGSPVERADVERRAVGALRALDESAAQPAAESIVAVLGTSAPDVLREQYNLAIPEEYEADIQKEIDLLSSPYATTSPIEGRNRADQLAYLRSLLVPVSIDMKGVVYRPLSTQFFRSPEAIQAFQDDPAWPEFLRRVGIDPEDASQVKQFIAAQKDAIDARP